MDEEVTKPDEEEFSKGVQFAKMLLGVGAGWLAKELAESGFVRIVKWHQTKNQTQSE